MVDDPKRPPVRLSDVARAAGCSAATVSRVLNAPETVNRDARERVEAAVRDLGYTRNAAARALRSRRSRTIGVILPTLKQPIFADFVATLQDSLAEEDYALVVTTFAFSSARELFQARLLIERGVEGLVLIGNSPRAELLSLLEGQNLPFLTTFTFRREVVHPMVGFDNVAAMAAAVDHLADLGHRDLAVIADGREANDCVEQRIAGAVAALERRGLTLPPDRLVEGSSGFEGGRNALSRVLGAARPPTAVLCTCDMMAYGALIECRARRLVVPRDLSVVGFDNLELSAFTFPALTTTESPAGEMARQAAGYLMARLAGRHHSARIEVEARLVLRDTTAPPSPGFARPCGREVS